MVLEMTSELKFSAMRALSIPRLSRLPPHLRRLKETIVCRSRTRRSQRVKWGEPEGVRKHLLSKKVSSVLSRVFRRKKGF